MRNKVLLAAALVALMAAPAFAAVQNVKVSGDIDSTYISRNHFGLGQQTSPGWVEDVGLVKQSVFVTQARVRIDADLSDNVSTTVGLINERGWAAETAAGVAAQNTDVQLYLAYATLREFLYSPLTVSVGRQVFSYGNGLVIGDGGPNNIATGNLGTIAADLTKRTTYDGIKAVLDYKPLTLDLIYFKNDQNFLTGAPDAVKTSSDVWGLNANYQLGDAMNSIVEGYFFARQTGDRSTTVGPNFVALGPANKGDQLYVPGLRVSTNPIKGLNLQAEAAWQFGRIARTTLAGVPVNGDNARRSAMAFQLMGSYTLPVLEKYKPTVNASFTHVSGDKNRTDHRTVSASPASRTVYTAWDPFNESQNGGTIYNSIFNLTNLNIFSLGGSVTPVEDVTATLTWTGLWADRRWHSTANPLVLVQPDGSASGTLATTSRKEMGSEYDLNVNYAYTEDVTLGVSLGWFIPGRTFDGNNDTKATQALAHVLVNF